MGRKKSKGKKVVKSVASAKSGGFAEAEDALKVGDRVMLIQLKSEEYNGKRGTIISLPTMIVDVEDCRYGVRLDGKDAPIAIRRQNIKKWKSTEQQLEERKNTLHGVAESLERKMSADELGMMRMQMNKLTVGKQRKLFGRKIQPMPDFYEELRLEGGGFPHGVDNGWADKYLRTVFEQSHGLPHLMELYMKEDGYEPGPGDVLKRVGTNDKTKLDWYWGPQHPGNVFPHNPEAYSSLIRHSFSNQIYRKEVLQQGSTHVAVGFVDLGILFAAILRGHQGDPPLRYIGVEMSCYAVAKTHVIWQMLKQTPNGTQNRQNHLRYIMQAWYSTTLDKGAVAELYSALNVLCVPSKQVLYHPDVKNLLVYWQGAATTTVTEARSQFARFTSDAKSYIGDLKRKVDRIDMAKYEITGDFGLTNDIPYAGNTLMFNCPDGTSPKAMNESVFSAFDLMEIAKLLSPKTSLIEAAQAYASANLSKLADWVIQERVVIDLVCAKFEDVVEDIAAAKPWTMSWSNVIDYVDHANFHRLAKLCSVHGDTVHFGYSMNWPVDVFGVNIIDYAGKELTKNRAQMIEAANATVDMVYKMFGWDKYLRSPPPTNPINTTAVYGLEQLYYKKWTSQFFSIARREGSCNVGNIEHKFGSPLSPTGCSTVAFTWTYDPDIKFQNAYQKKTIETFLQVNDKIQTVL